MGRKPRLHSPTPEELARRRSTRAEYMRRYRANETREQATGRRISNALAQSIRRSRETQEETERRRHGDRLRFALRVEKETEQEKQRRRALSRQRIALRRRFGYTPINVIKMENSNQHYSGTPENTHHKNIVPANVSPTTVHIPDDLSPQPSPVKMQKKQIDDQQVYDKKRMDTATTSQMSAKSMLDSSQMPVQQHRNVAQASQTSISKLTLVEKNQPREKQIFVVADHQRCVMSNLASLWRNRKLCDASIGNGLSTVMVHKVVLSAVCPKLLSVFGKNISSHKFLEINFPKEVSTEALNAFAEYMYNGLLDIDPDILQQLKIIAKRLGMKEFEQLCNSRIPSTIPQQPSLICNLREMMTNLSDGSNTTVPTSLPSSSIISVTSQSAPSVTTQVIDVKQEISEAELAQVKEGTAAVFEQESEIDSLDASESDNSSSGIVSTVKTEPVGLEDDIYGEQNNEFNTSITLSNSFRIPSTTLNSTVVSTTELVLPFLNTTDSNTTNVIHGISSKLKSNVFESSLVSDLSPVSCIVEQMCSQSSPIREDPSEPLNRTITTQSIDNIMTSESNEGVYPVGLFTAGGDNLPLSPTQVTNIASIDLNISDDLT